MWAIGRGPTEASRRRSRARTGDVARWEMQSLFGRGGSDAI
jgi:hypothetical protein